jgi:hypothetical protein
MDTQKALRELRELVLLDACTEADATAAADILDHKPETFKHMDIGEAVDMALELVRVRASK